jgi:hypothetical protein
MFSLGAWLDLFNRGTERVLRHGWRILRDCTSFFEELVGPFFEPRGVVTVELGPPTLGVVVQQRLVSIPNNTLLHARDVLQQEHDWG